MTFASGNGTDSAACGSLGAPCRTLQQAINNTPSGGYVLLQGPGDFEPAEISKSINIVGEGGARVRAKPTGDGRNAIMIFGAADLVVRLRGLTIDGGGVGLTGLTWLNGKTLDIANCAVRNFGIGVAAQSGNGGRLTIINSSVSDNGFYGVRYVSPFNAVAQLGYIEGLRLTNNAMGGLHVERGASAVVVNSTATGHKSAFGFGEQGGAGSGLVMRTVTSTGNKVGVKEGGGGDVAISASNITGNDSAATGFESGVRSYGDNIIRANANDTLNIFFPATKH